MLGAPRRWCARHKYAIGGTVLVLGAVLAWARWAPMRPLFDNPCSTVLLDRDGQLLGATVAGDGQWRFPALDHVPQRFATCLVQFEDRHFLHHPGIRPQSLVRAWLQNRKAGHVVSGGSTLTMQVARLSRGGSERTYGEKLIEALLALRIELRWSKAEILRLFAANAPFGGNVVGLDAAAWRYYGRPADRLGWSECATLAVLPNAPSAIYPGKGHEALRAKRDRLLDRLLAIGAIDRTEWSLAKEEPMPGRTAALPQRAPQLLSTVMAQGHAGQVNHSTIDGRLQDRASATADRYAPRLEANEVHNAAAIILDVHSGKVLAYVGNLSGAGSAHAGQVDIVQARRSTGSVLKPFLYADMLQSGELLPDMLVADVPTRYNGFTPRNYDEHFSGAVPASEALSRSLNVPAVRALHTHGVERTLRLLRSMGLKSIDRSADNYGLTLIVGGAESTLWELAGAYASMGRVLDDYGRGGLHYHAGDIHAPVVLMDLVSAEKDSGVIKEDPSPVLSATSVWFTLKALRNVARPLDEQGWNQFTDQQRIAWKTGTSFGHRDAWAIGLTDRYCVAVWTGNASGEGRPGLTGTLAAAPLLFDLFALLPAGQGFDPPYDEMTRAAICSESGFRAGRDCPTVDTLPIPHEGLRTPVCPFHKRILLDPTGRYRIASGQGESTPWFVLPPAMELYYAQRSPSYRPLPSWLSGEEGTDDMPMEVLYPDNGSTVLVPVELDGSCGNMVMELAHRDRHAIVHWDLDGIYLGATVGEHRMALSPSDGDHLLTLTDDAGHILRRSFTVVNGARNASASYAP